MVNIFPLQHYSRYFSNLVKETSSCLIRLHVYSGKGLLVQVGPWTDELTCDLLPYAAKDRIALFMDNGDLSNVCNFLYQQSTIKKNRDIFLLVWCP